MFANPCNRGDHTRLLQNHSTELSELDPIYTANQNPADFHQAIACLPTIPSPKSFGGVTSMPRSSPFLFAVSTYTFFIFGGMA
mmetsp:Transcript_22221/g.41371  ORF Transcript_22221/g.41371 Transcript_22221/m.41371 type:complete len:83 (+) Transcript_22221:54-302(+)